MLKPRPSNLLPKRRFIWSCRILMIKWMILNDDLPIQFISTTLIQISGSCLSHQLAFPIYSLLRTKPLLVSILQQFIKLVAKTVLIFTQGKQLGVEYKQDLSVISYLISNNLSFFLIFVTKIKYIRNYELNFKGNNNCYEYHLKNLNCEC